MYGPIPVGIIIFTIFCVGFVVCFVVYKLTN
jgi:hypothetical protein